MVGTSQQWKPASNLQESVSIPKRVLGWLERAWPVHKYRPLAFQSLRGFWVGWNTILASSFASLPSFQSLRGFWVGWNGLSHSSQRAPFGVSIPKRVLGWLELRKTTQKKPCAKQLCVSIPKRVLGWLERWFFRGHCRLPPGFNP